MSKNMILIFGVLLMLMLTACSEKKELSDGYGNFEAKEIIISAKSQGEIVNFHIEEGMKLETGQQIGIIDTTMLALKKEQLIAQIKGFRIKVESGRKKIKGIERKIELLAKEKTRIIGLFRDNATTEQNRDRIVAEYDIAEINKKVAEEDIKSLDYQIEALEKQIAQLNESLDNCKIINPIAGIVLEKYLEENELAAPGRPLYKIADLRKMILRVYISGSQLSNIKIGQNVEVLIDLNNTQNQSLSGKISWISSSAEFTPKNIQTKEERVSQVYAVKILVNNEDGKLKIGMPGEVDLLN